jgi:hypothetical protein
MDDKNHVYLFLVMNGNKRWGDMDIRTGCQLGLTTT